MPFAIRGHRPLGEARDELTKEWRALCDRLDACRTLRELEEVSRELRAMRVDADLGELLNAVDVAAGPPPKPPRRRRASAQTEDDLDTGAQVYLGSVDIDNPQEG